MKKNVRENNEQIVKEMHKILLNNSFGLLSKKRFVNFFSCLTDEVKAYLLGVPMYEPIVGEKVLIEVSGKEVEGVVVDVNHKELTATVQYETESRRYFKTAEEVINFMNTGDYDYSNSSNVKKEEYNLLGVYFYKTSRELTWGSIEPNNN